MRHSGLVIRIVAMLSLLGLILFGPKLGDFQPPTPTATQATTPTTTAQWNIDENTPHALGTLGNIAVPLWDGPLFCTDCTPDNFVYVDEYVGPLSSHRYFTVLRYLAYKPTDPQPTVLQGKTLSIPIGYSAGGSKADGSTFYVTATIDTLKIHDVIFADIVEGSYLDLPPAYGNHWRSELDGIAPCDDGTLPTLPVLHGDTPHGPNNCGGKQVNYF